MATKTLKFGENILIFRPVHSTIWSVHSNLFLLSYFSFAKLFELACLTLLNFDLEGYFLFLEIPVNLNQYRAAIGVFNNRILTTGKKLYYFWETSNMKNNLLFTTIINVVVLVFICFMFKAFLTKKVGNIGLHWLLYLS